MLLPPFKIIDYLIFLTSNLTTRLIKKLCKHSQILLILEELSLIKQATTTKKIFYTFFFLLRRVVKPEKKSNKL
jgi:hypothetical protein